MAKVPARAPSKASDFGPRGEAILATLRAVQSLTAMDIGRMVAAQERLEPARFYRAWHAVYLGAQRAEVVAFQHTVSYGYGTADRQLARASADLPDREGVLFRKAVVGRLLALFAGPDIDGEDLKVLSRAWTTTRG